MKVNNIDLHIIDSCNLNCASCGHFSPLVKDKSGIPIESLIDSINSLRTSIEKSKSVYPTLTLTGGEVSLHKDLIKIINISRTYYKGPLQIWTNGTLYKYNPRVFETILRNDVKVIMTDYRQKWTSEAIQVLSDNLGDNLSYVERTTESAPNTVRFLKGFIDKDLHITKKEAVRCYPRANCVQLKSGRIYPCQYIAHYNYLHDKFGTELSYIGDVSSDFIDLKTSSWSDVENYLENYYSSLCSHCLDCTPYESREFQDWTKSSKSINEWIK